MQRSAFEEQLKRDNRPRYPYYILAPRYVRTSAGIRALHILCHWLNTLGELAYVLIYPDWEGLQINPELITPVLTESIARQHFEANLTPITLYPEVVDGNPFKSPVIARWIANYPGLLGGSRNFDEEELCFCFSRQLAATTGHSNLLNIPVVDIETYKSTPVVPRSGSCYYAGKYKEIHNGKVFGLPFDCFEITRDKPDQLSPPEIASLFRRSDLFYCFEDSALITEAGLCGCPVVLMKNEHFKYPIAMDEAGWDGFAWGDSVEEIRRARSTVHKCYGNYVRNLPRFFSQLEKFIELTQAKADTTPYLSPVSLIGRRTLDPNQAYVWRSWLEQASLDLFSYRTGIRRAGLIWAPTLALNGAASSFSFVSGWCDPEMNCRWSHGRLSVLTFTPPRNVHLLKIVLKCFTDPSAYQRSVSVYRDRKLVCTLVFEGTGQMELLIDNCEIGRSFTLMFVHEPIGSRASLGIDPNDMRELGILMDHVIAVE